MPDAIPVWLVEDDEGFRSSIASALWLTEGVDCTGAYGSVAAALADARHAPPPAVLLLDVNLPGASGLEALQAFRTTLPGTRVVMLTIHDDAETIFRALEGGASGYVVKGGPLPRLVEVIREAAAGGMLLPPTVARRVQEYFAGARATSDYGLTAREQEVLRLMCDGYGQKQIAEHLFLSLATVNTHVQTIYEKLHVHTGTAAVSKAFRERLI
ncbi:MAG TPA: response regulator transcription factor [Rhodothermales bacterium]|nr:response regulator transcription factor [Rhodothermales bacterium]